MKSKDGATVGAFDLRPAGRVMAVMQQLGWMRISKAEFRTLKAELIRRMVQPETPEPARV
jgi:hypothetical protein